MVQGIIPSTLMTLASLPLALNLHSTPVSTPQTGFQAVQAASPSQTIYVQKEDTLRSLALRYYGDEAFWTVIANDNKEITDVNVIEEGMRLTIRRNKPTESEALREDLTKQVVSIEPLSLANVLPSRTPTPTTQADAVGVSTGGPLNQTQIEFLGRCEAGLDPTKNTGNGYYGAFQFSYGTWKSMNTGYERADLAPLDVQIDAVQRLLQRSSIYTQFPACARRMQSQGII